MKAVKIIMTDDGKLMAKPCDVEPEDAEGAQPVESVEALPAMLESMLAQSGESEDKPMMDGEAEFVAGYDNALGKGSGY